MPREHTELKRRSAAITAVFSVLVFASLFRLFGAGDPRACSWVLDASWQAVLEFQATHGLRSGTGIIFTSGPLGYLYTDVSFGHLIWQKVLFSLAWAGLLAWAASCVFRRLPLLAACLFAAWCLALPWLSDSMQDACTLFVMACACSVLAAGPRKRRWGALASVAALAVFSLIKFTFFVAAAAGIALAVFARLVRRDAGAAAAIAAGYCVAFLSLWFLCGQDAGGLLAWIRGGLELSAGYSAMAHEPKGGVLALCLGAGAVFLYSALRAAWRGEAAYPLILAAYAFLSWKHAFTRADSAHVFDFIVFLPLASGLLMAWRRQAEPGRTNGSGGSGGGPAFVLIVALCASAAAAQGAGLASPSGIKGNAGLIASLLSGHAAEHFDALKPNAALDASMTLPLARSLIGNSTVDVINYRQLYALAGGFNYRPRPVFQGYTAYTSWLQLLNLKFYEGPDAPGYILLRIEPGDRRFATFDDAALMPYVFQNYRPVAEDRGFLVMRRAGGRSPYRLSLIREQEVSFGEPVSLPAPEGRMLIMQVSMHPTVLGRLLRALYQPPQLTMTVRAGGPGRIYRFVPEMAGAGFIISPLIEGNADVIGLYQGQARPVTDVIFNRPEGAAPLTGDLIGVRLYETAAPGGMPDPHN